MQCIWIIGAIFTYDQVTVTIAKVAIKYSSYLKPSGQLQTQFSSEFLFYNLDCEIILTNYLIFQKMATCSALYNVFNFRFALNQYFNFISICYSLENSRSCPRIVTNVIDRISTFSFVYSMLAVDDCNEGNSTRHSTRHSTRPVLRRVVYRGTTQTDRVAKKL